MNAARFGFRNEIHWVRHVLAILGDREVRRWVRLIATFGAGQDRTSDLVLCAPVRARFGELLAPLTRHDDYDLFLLGLLSMLHVMLEMPMSEVQKKIPPDSETKARCAGEPGLLRPIRLLMLAHESGGWEAAPGYLRRSSPDLDADTVAAWYWQSQQWAREVSGGA